MYVVRLGGCWDFKTTFGPFATRDAALQFVRDAHRDVADEDYTWRMYEVLAPNEVAREFE